MEKEQSANGNQDNRYEGGGCHGGSCDHDANNPGMSEEVLERQALKERLLHIKHKIVVMSGKGGVGKSTVAVNLAAALALAGKRVGLLDVDIHGPSVPTMLGLENEIIRGNGKNMIPVDLDGLKVMSLGFMLKNQDEAVIWRGPLKMGVIKQFIKDVVWGDLDYLIIDSPPGTGDEPLSICQLIDDLDGAVIVTTPQKIAALDVRKSITFCRSLNVPIIGVIENMSGFACPDCGKVTQILSSGGGKAMSDDMGVTFMGSIPMDAKIAEACDSGQAFIKHYKDTPTAKIMASVIGSILEMDSPKAQDKKTSGEVKKEGTNMKVAIPLADGKLTAHFGHCRSFALVDADPAEKKILGRVDIEAPQHEPGLLPPWLAERGATVIIAGGMGQRAQGLFTEQGIKVIVGAAAELPETLVLQYLSGTLITGSNVCDH
jgi:ATP-binding protein involved in chromosome partitioning